MNKVRSDICGVGILCPDAFWSEPGESDIRVLAEQNAGRRFDVSVVRAIARRCAHGFPQVIVCHTFAGEEPFPTTFWLTCPYLDRKCGELESQQQISRLEEVFTARRKDVLAWHQRYAALRESLIVPAKARQIAEKNLGLLKAVLGKGVGGINYCENPQAAKCLHLQTATWLGMKRHPASDWLAEKLGDLECDNVQCATFAG